MRFEMKRLTRLQDECLKMVPQQGPQQKVESSGPSAPATKHLDARYEAVTKGSDKEVSKPMDNSFTPGTEHPNDDRHDRHDAVRKGSDEEVSKPTDKSATPATSILMRVLMLFTKLCGMILKQKT